MSSGVDDNGSDKESTSDNYYDSDQKLEGYSNVDVWYCTNCTMPNYKEVYHCEDCGEHNESAISGYDSFLSSIGQADLIDPDTVRNAQRHGPDSLSKAHTAIGFDERMLLHFEVLPKSPHIERPDRLKAIAAGLAAAGMLALTEYDSLIFAPNDIIVPWKFYCFPLVSSVANLAPVCLGCDKSI